MGRLAREKAISLDVFSVGGIWGARLADLVEASFSEYNAERYNSTILLRLQKCSLCTLPVLTRRKQRHF